VEVGAAGHAYKSTWTHNIRREVRDIQHPIMADFDNKDVKNIEIGIVGGGSMGEVWAVKSSVVPKLKRRTGDDTLILGAWCTLLDNAVHDD
jgi:hypothetical protein